MGLSDRGFNIRIRSQNQNNVEDYIISLEIGNNEKDEDGYFIYREIIGEKGKNKMKLIISSIIVILFLFIPFNFFFNKLKYSC